MALIDRIADTRDDELELKGIQPIHQVAYKLFKGSRFVMFMALGFLALCLGMIFVESLNDITHHPYFPFVILFFGGLTVISFLLVILTFTLFLRKPPFDDWVFEVAQKRLGTQTIFYNSKCLYIGYDVATAKEVDKKDFVTEMSDKSNYYSYFYVNTFIDQQVIQVECTKRQPIPERAMLNLEEDLHPNIIPVGLTINNLTQRVSPISWTLNPNAKNPEFVETMPSVSFIICGGTGCHAKGTEILMYDGSLKNVEDITINDILMGDDSTPRRVKQLIRNKGQMYRILPNKGEPFIVNDEHVLSLKHTVNGNIINVSVKEYLQWSAKQKHLYKLYRTDVAFPETEQKIQPYLLGLILGDGCLTHTCIEISSADKEVAEYIENIPLIYDDLAVSVQTKPETNCKNYIIKNKIKTNKKTRLYYALDDLGLIGKTSDSKFIPNSYKVSSKQQRLDLLAGLLDTDGGYSRGCYDYITKSYSLAKDIEFVARSLGLYTSIKESYKKSQTMNTPNKYYRLTISGDLSQIPCRVSRKIANIRKQKKDVLRTGFKVEKLGIQEYYGFSLDGNQLYVMGDFTVTHNSGKSVLEQNIIAHISRFSDDFQCVGVDCKRVEFAQLRGVKGVKGVALDVRTAASAISTFQDQMMARFKFMEENQTNNIYKLKNLEVDYYEVFGRKYQFDEMFELKTDIIEAEEGRDYSKLMVDYPDGRKPRIISIKEIYEGLENDAFHNPQLPEVKGYNSYIKKGDITKSRGMFKPKILLFLVDEMNELMTSDDYKSVETIKQNMGSIARLGRAAGVHLALAMQRASGGTVSTDLMNNIQQSILLGAFDSGSSTNLFEKDISNLSKPDIKGRAFMQVGKKDIFEVQTYWIEPEDSWEFDESLRMTYDNAVFLEQKKRRKQVPDELGFVEQYRYDGSELKADEILEEMQEDEEIDLDNSDEEEDIDIPEENIVGNTEELDIDTIKEEISKDDETTEGEDIYNQDTEEYNKDNEQQFEVVDYTEQPKVFKLNIKKVEDK